MAYKEKKIKIFTRRAGRRSKSKKNLRIKKETGNESNKNYTIK